MKASVVIPTFNRAHILLDTINSVLAQDYEPIEIIVVDDGSTDSTLEVLAPLIKEKKVILKALSHRGRPAPARNLGLSVASGDVIFLLDSDDLMLPGKIAFTMREFSALKDRDIGLCCTDFLLRKADGSERSHFSRPFYSKLHEVPKHRVAENVSLLVSKNAYNALLAANYIGTSSVAIPKEIVDAGFRFDETLTNSDDYDLWLRIVRKHDVLVVEHPCHVYMENADGVLSTSKRNGNKWRANIRILKRELKTISDAECKASANLRLADNYRALFQCALINRQWIEASKAILGSLTADFTGTAGWLWSKMERRIVLSWKTR